MASLVEKYQGLLKKLLPPGRAWENVKEHEILKAIATEFCRVEERASDLLETEFDPLLTTELLPDWEQLLGIPDECTPEDQTLDERRIQVQQKLSALGGLSAQYYVDLAKLLGFDITVFNPIPFRVGRARVGDGLYNNSIRDTFVVGTNRVGDQLRVFGWQFYFIARIPITELTKFRVGTARVGEPLVSFGNSLLECTIRKSKPAHTGVVFLFGN